MLSGFFITQLIGEFAAKEKRPEKALF